MDLVVLNFFVAIFLVFVIIFSEQSSYYIKSSFERLAECYKKQKKAVTQKLNIPEEHPKLNWSLVVSFLQITFFLTNNCLLDLLVN